MPGCGRQRREEISEAARTTAAPFSPCHLLGHRDRPTGGNPARRDVIAHLRDVFNDQTYESLACKGETMTTAGMVSYAYDQIDQARTELEHSS